MNVNSNITVINTSGGRRKGFWGFKPIQKIIPLIISEVK